MPMGIPGVLVWEGLGPWMRLGQFPTQPTDRSNGLEGFANAKFIPIDSARAVATRLLDNPNPALPRQSPQHTVNGLPLRN